MLFRSDRWDALDAAAKAACDELDRLAFVGDDNPYEWSAPEWMACLKEGDILCSQLCLLERDIQVGEQIVRVGGIGGVATHPETRGRGLSSTALRGAASFLQSRGIRFGLLLTSQNLIPFYGRLGWQPVPGPLVFDFHGQKVSFEEVVMVLPLAGEPWPEGGIDLCGLPW